MTPALATHPERASFAGVKGLCLRSETFPFQRLIKVIPVPRRNLMFSRTGGGLLHPSTSCRTLQALSRLLFYFLPREKADHHSVCSLVNLVRCKTENGMEQMQWYAKSQYVRRKK
jgi:hypothetical protein